MKNVKVIFNDTDYELVKKACQQYDKLVKDYHEKNSFYGIYFAGGIAVCCQRVESFTVAYYR